MEVEVFLCFDSEPRRIKKSIEQILSEWDITSPNLRRECQEKLDLMVNEGYTIIDGDGTK